MDLKQNTNILFHKSPVFRFLSLILTIIIFLVLFSFITYKARGIPVIESVNPPVGSPGNIMIISGHNFGNAKSTSDFVEVGGSRITASGYLSWSDSQIRIILPANVQDGLVIVQTKSGKSKPGFFANEAGIPVSVPPDTKTSLPVITSISPETAYPGSILTINGTNFGTVRNNALVYFTANREERDSAQTENEPLFISASEKDFDYIYWSDSELHVHVPDGAASGQIRVVTEKGESNVQLLTVQSPAGTKKYSSKKTYVIQIAADIDNINSKHDTSLTLRFPRPQISASQPSVELTECTPEPVLSNYQNTVIHQLEFSKNSAKKLRFNHNFVVEACTVETEINSKQVKPFTAKDRILYTQGTSPDTLIKCDDEEYKELCASIIKKETNPYEKAKLIYNYMLSNYELLPELRKPGSDVKELLTEKKGDAYDFTVVFTTLLRAAGIPSVCSAGILVDSDLKCINHWWNEFYIEKFGWVPVDIALAAGLEYKSFRPVENPAQYFFGNLDSQHISFSYGWNDLKSSLVNGNIVYRDRTYALQSIWEESSSGTVNYSSLWANPVIVGIY